MWSWDYRFEREAVRTIHYSRAMSKLNPIEKPAGRTYLTLQSGVTAP